MGLALDNLPEAPAANHIEILAEKLRTYGEALSNLQAVRATYDTYIEHFKNHDPNFAEIHSALPQLQAQVEKLREDLVEEARQTKQTYSDERFVVRYADPKKVVVDYDILRQWAPDILDFPGLVGTIYKVDTKLFDSLSSAGKITPEVVALARKEVPTTKGGQVTLKLLP